MSAVLLFPGQGSQFVGMGGDYLRSFSSVARRFEQAADALGIDLLRVVAKGPRAALMQTDVAQVAIYALSVSITELLQERGVPAVAVAGHSLGQFSALVAAGALSFEDGLSLVVWRGRLMHELNQSLDGGMLAVTGLAAGVVEQAIEGIESVWVTNQNAPGQIILSGLRRSLSLAQPALQAVGGRVTWLDVAGPYHSPLFAATAERFSPQVRAAPLRDARIPLVANSSASTLCGAQDLRDELVRHMLMPVRWSESMRRLSDVDARLLIEVGPGKVMRGLALRNALSLRCLGTDTVREMEQTCAVWSERESCGSS